MRLAILSTVLFLSGISALIFETLWLRLSGLAFGNSIWAAALILSSFMAGLALGTAIASSAQFRSRPLKVYAALEIAVAVFGCTIVFGLPIIGEILRPIFQALWSHQTILLALRVLISFVILLIPTTAMGLTLPVILEDPALTEQRFGRAIGLLYGFNTIGAVIGALVGELLLVKAFGLWGTSVCAGLLNCVAAIIALVLARREERPTRPPLQTLSEKARWLRFERSYSLPWRLLIVSFGGGLLLLCLEVVWFRFLRLYIASSVSAFSLMLAVVLAGIGIGGAISGLASRTSRTALSILFLLAGIATLLCYKFFPIPTLKPGEANFYFESWQTITVLATALMFPVSLISGVLFPTIASAVQETVENRMNSVGIVTLFNTAGAAIGPILAGFILLPRIGFQSALIFCAIGYAVLALLVSSRTFWASGSSRLILIVFLGVFAVLIAMFPFHRDNLHFANARKLYESEDQHLVTKIEGTSDTWQLLRRDLFGRPYYYRLVTNGFSMSATNPVNQRYMRSFAYLPVTFHPSAHDALLIAYGCGVTADALTHDLDLHIDVVDISKEVFSLADDYRDVGYSNPLRNPRVSAIVQDGRFFLEASPKRYDIITGEPPPPKVAGGVNLYTEQFFRLMSDRLNDGGVATFWLPIYQLTVSEAKSILLAFHHAFPNTIIWAGPDEEWIMMGIKGVPEKIDHQQLSRLFRDGSNTKSDLARIGIESPEEIAAMFVMDGDEIARIASDTKPLTDVYPRRLGDSTEPDPAIHEFASNYMRSTAAAEHFRSSRLAQQVWPDAATTELEPFFVIREMRYHSRYESRNWLADLDIHLRGSNLREPVLETVGTNSFRVELAEKFADGLNPPPAETVPDLIAAALADRNYNRATELLDAKRSSGSATPDDLLLLTYLSCVNHDVGKAESIAQTIQNHDDPLAKWLFGKLQAEYGFRPPD